MTENSFVSPILSWHYKCNFILACNIVITESDARGEDRQGELAEVAYRVLSCVWRCQSLAGTSGIASQMTEVAERAEREQKLGLDGVVVTLVLVGREKRTDRLVMDA